MKPVILMLTLALLLPDRAFPAASVDYSPITGVWRAQIGGLPAFVLTISDEGEALTGAILFYSIRRDEDGSNPRATPGTPEPLFRMKFDGKVLEFQVSHRRAHPPRTAKDPPVSFRMKLTGPGQAEFVNDAGGAGDPVLLRRDE